MAAPNIVNVSTITARTVGINLTATTATSVVSNASSTNRVLKVNVLNVANTSTSVSADITINYYNAAGATGNSFPIVSSVTVPAKTTLTVIDKGTQYYLEENTSIGAVASLANVFVVTASFEEIS
jgi:hypothetical protein